MTTMWLDKNGWPVEQIKGKPFINWIRNLIHGRDKVCRNCWLLAHSKTAERPVGTGSSRDANNGAPPRRDA